MRPELSSCVAALTLLSGLAGCLASGDEAGPAGIGAEASSNVQAGAEPLADAGAIEGLVVDDSVQPIAGATVALIELEVQATTDEGGAYSITNIPPGEYRLAAVALGYESVGLRVEIVAGETLQRTVTLAQLPITVAYAEVLGPWAGYFECRTGTPSFTGECGWVGQGTSHPTALYPNDKSIFRFNMTSDDYQTFVGDMRWRPTTTASSTSMRLAFSHDNRTSTHWWCSGEGPAPLQWRYEKSGDNKCANYGGNKSPAEPTTKLALRTYANVPFGTTTNPVYLSLQQKFEIMVSIFYGEPAPTGYTAFGDS